SKFTLASPGRSEYSRNVNRLSLMRYSPPYQSQGVRQWVTVVKGAWGSAAVTGHSCRYTTGGVYCHFRPQSGKRAPGRPTVSPVVKYTSCGATCIRPYAPPSSLIQIWDRPGS